MSIFDLPYPEYIEAMEKIIEREAREEEETAPVVAALTGRSERTRKRTKWWAYSKGGHAQQWWQGIWTQQYEMQGGVV
jgi:hypothetical protein